MNQPDDLRLYAPPSYLGFDRKTVGGALAGKQNGGLFV